MGTVGTIFETKEKRMKWFDRWFAKKCKQAWEDAKDSPDETMLVSNKIGRATVGVREHDWHENLNIQITNANGGKIVMFRRYDHKTDRHDNKIYVIPDDNDFNVELGKLITLESMRG
jgi:hypothetical protein